jgi:hypothetical protein
MNNLTKLVLLSLLLIPFVVVAGAIKALSEEMPMMVLQTDNGSTDVEVTIEKGIVRDSQFAIDRPQLVTFSLRFVDPATGAQIEHLNYQLMVADANGNIVHKVHEGHAHNGMNSYSLLFSDTGSFTLTVDVEGVGAMKPYDSTYSGLASSSVTVTPEFPVSMMAIIATVIGISIAASRFKNVLKL